MNNKDIVEMFFKEAYEKCNCNYVMEYFAEDYIDNSPAGARSNKDASEIIKSVDSMFKDMKVTILDMIEEGDMVASRVRFEGTHVGKYIDKEGTGKRIQWEALENFKLKEGKVIESWGYWPDLEMLYKMNEK